ncbi:dentin sialophosphoprotein-like isoform X2 [Argopecten irradians]|uniref:dentin sialophosphoprotein-like isoform X2 n=1 Tax=Argopecten irradians TaxID=31199 RepID=UPI00371886D5
MMEDARPKKFIKLLAKHLGSNDNARDDYNPKRLLNEAVGSLPEGPLKTAISQKLEFYTKKLKLLIHKHGKASEQSEHVKQKFPYNLYTTKKPYQLPDPGTIDHAQTQQILGALLSKRLDVDPVESLMELLVNCEEENVDILLLNLTCGITSYLGLLKTMHLYFLVIQPKAENAVENQTKAQLSKGKIKTDTVDMCQTLCEQVKKFLSLCHIRRSLIQKAETPVYLYSYWDLLSSILAVFIDLYLLANRKSHKPEQSARRLCNLVCYVTEDKPSFRLDALLQMSKVHTNIDLLLPLVRRTFELKPVTGDFQHYLKYVLALRTVCDFTEESNTEDNCEINSLKRQTRKIVPAPKNFLDWLENRSEEILDEMPVEDKRFKGSNVTKFILDEAEDNLLSLLTDTLTHFDEETEDDDSKQEKKSAKRKKRKMEAKMNGHESRSDSDLFFLDIGGTKQMEDKEENVPDTELFFLDKGDQIKNQGVEMEDPVPKQKKKQKQQKGEATEKPDEGEQTEVFVIDTSKYWQKQDDAKVECPEESDGSLEITLAESCVESSEEEEIEANESDIRDMEEDESDIEGQSDENDEDEEQMEEDIDGDMEQAKKLDIKDMEQDESDLEGQSGKEDVEEHDEEEQSEESDGEDLEEQSDGSEEGDDMSDEDDIENSDEELGDDNSDEEDNVADGFEKKSDQEQTEEMLACFVNKSPGEAQEEDLNEREVTLSTPKQEATVPELPVPGRSFRQRKTQNKDSPAASRRGLSSGDKSKTPSSMKTKSTDKSHQKLVKSPKNSKGNTSDEELSVATAQNNKTRKQSSVTSLEDISPQKSSPNKQSLVNTPKSASSKKGSSIETPNTKLPKTRTSLNNASPKGLSSVDTPIDVSPKKELSNTAGSAVSKKQLSAKKLNSTSPRQQTLVATPIASPGKRLFKDIVDFTSEEIEGSVSSLRKRAKGGTTKNKSNGNIEVNVESCSDDTSVKTPARTRRNRLKTQDQGNLIDEASSPRKSRAKKDVFDFESDDEFVLKSLIEKQKMESTELKTPETKSSRLKTPNTVSGKLNSPKTESSKVKTPKSEPAKFKTPKNVSKPKKSASSAKQLPVNGSKDFDQRNEIIPNSNDNSDGESASSLDFPMLNSPEKEKVSSRSNKTSQNKRSLPTPDYVDTPRPPRTRRTSNGDFTSLKPSDSSTAQNTPEKGRVSRRKSGLISMADSEAIVKDDVDIAALTAENLSIKAASEKRYSLRATRRRRESGSSDVSTSSMVTRSRKRNTSGDCSTVTGGDGSNSVNDSQKTSGLKTLDEDTDADDEVTFSIKEKQTPSSKRKSILSTPADSPRKSGRRYSLREKD